MDKKRFCKVVFVVGFLIFVFAGVPSLSSASASQVILKIGLQEPGTGTYEKASNAARIFKAFVEDKTQGNVKVEIYLGGSLGGEREMVESLKMGTLEMTWVSAAPISGFFPPIMIYDIPYLFADRAVAWKVINSDFNNEVMAAMKKQTGMRGLAVGACGFRSFTCNVRQIRSPADMKGLKFRIQESPAYVALVKALGGTPVPMPGTEMYMACKQGVVDGQENPPSVIKSMKMYEVQKYYTLDNHVFDSEFFLINDKIYQSLSPEYRDIVTRAARTSQNVHFAMENYASFDALEFVKKYGMQVYTPSSVELAQFKKLAQPAVRTMVEEKAGSEWVSKMLKAVEQAEAALNTEAKL